jgi:hypothetical protein
MEPFAASGADAVHELPLNAWTGRFPQVTAGITTRRGGVSEAEYSTLNCGLHVGDDPERVVQNRRIAARAAGMPFEAWTCAEQVHGAEVVPVTAADRGRGRDRTDTAVPKADGLITREKGILLAGMFADCVPLYFYDPVHQAIGLAHAGWRGTAAQIAKATVEAMSAHFGTRSDELLAAIGPSIGSCCYEVGEETARAFNDVAEEGVSIFALPGGKYRLDLKLINRHIMMKAGILPIHIEMSQWCTGCRTDLFFSHRIEKGRTGRMAAWIGLKE